MSDKKRTEDYIDTSAEDEAPSPGSRLNSVITELAKLELLRRDYEEKLESVKGRIKIYEESILPSAMEEMGAQSFTTKAGLKVEVSQAMFAKFPKDTERAERAFKYLEETGNDGLVKRAISIQYGRESSDKAQEVMRMLDEAGISEHATVQMTGSIHPQSLLKFLREERKAGRPVPLADFGAFEKTVAKIKF